MKGNNLSISDAFKPISGFFRRFHSIMFFLVVSGGLAVAILMLLSIINLSSSTASSSDQVVNGSFDEATIKSIEDGTSNDILPGNRASPFIE